MAYLTSAGITSLTETVAMPILEQGLGNVLRTVFRATDGNFDRIKANAKDLQLAIFDLITYYVKDEHKQRQTLGGATLQNQGTAGVRNSTDFPDHIKRVLDLHRVII